METTAQPSAVPERKPGGMTPWIILALWFAWLAALVAMSFPEWGKSKRDLIDSKGRTETREMAPQ